MYKVDIAVLAEKALYQALMVVLDAGVDSDPGAYGEQVAEAVGELTSDKELYNQILDEAARKKPMLASYILNQKKN